MASPTPPASGPAPAPPPLPAVFRPRRARIVSLVLAVVVLALLAVVAVVLPGGPRGFHTPDRLGVFAVGVAVAGALWVMSRARMGGEGRGLYVVNLIRRWLLEWRQVCGHGCLSVV